MPEQRLLPCPDCGNENIQTSGDIAFCIECKFSTTIEDWNKRSGHE